MWVPPSWCREREEKDRQAGPFRTAVMLFVLMSVTCCVRNASMAFGEPEGLVKHFYFVFSPFRNVLLSLHL